ncbi:MAG: discoidin domain-containing protein [Flavobacteriaceae bacterium]
MKLKLKLLFQIMCCVVLITASACSSDSKEPEEPKVVDTDGDGVEDSKDECPTVAGLASLNGCPEEEEEEDVWTVNVANQQALNVVFFIPTDFASDEGTVTDISGHISDVMLYMQAWFKKQMEYNGYGSKTFGLMTNQHGKVHVLVVKGQYSSTHYNGRSVNVKPEVEEYLAENPEFDKSAHTLVLAEKGANIGFNGLGKWCFATSADYSLTDTGKTFDGFALKTCESLGGIMHELGHGLNLPHNCQKASEEPNVALMSFGNHTYEGGNPEKVYLTQSSSAILNVNSLFNKTTNGISYYMVEPLVEIKSVNITKNNVTAAIVINASFTSNTPVTHTYAGFDFVNAGANPPNDNYDEITYLKAPTQDANGVYTFQVEVPYNDLFNTYQVDNKDEAVIEINVLTENGFRIKPFDHYYTTNTLTQVPNDDIIVGYTAFEYSDRSSWTVTANTSTSNTERQAEKMVDGNESSYWHSLWPYYVANRGPHEITVDMGTTKAAAGVYILSNRDHNDQYRPKNITIQTSTDGTTWTTAIDSYTVPTYAEAERLSLNFASSLNFRYFKVLVSERYTNTTSAEENLIIAELDIY